MSDNKENQSEQGLKNVEVALTQTEQFFEKNQKAVTIGAIAVLVIVALVWIVNTQYIAPMKDEAQKEMFNAQYYFETDSFNLALNGDGMNDGFLKIIDEYGSTPAGHLAQYYAGVCYLNLGEYENAKKHFKAFTSDDELLNSFAIGLTGDAEAELGNAKEAMASYQKAVDQKNKITAPIFLMKLAALYETNGQPEKAKECYKQVKDDYPTSSQANIADKYMQSVQ